MNVIQANTGNQSQTHDNVIVSLMRAMLADFPAQYRKNYPTKEAAGAFKQRLVGKLSGFHFEDVLDGYEACIDASPTFMPSLPDILASVRSFANKRIKQEANNAEAKIISALPAPTHEVDALAMLGKAKDDSGKSELSASERLAKARDEHIATLKAHSTHYSRRYASIEQSCMANGCRNSGALSGGLTGHGNFYCAEHFRAAV